MGERPSIQKVQEGLRDRIEESVSYRKRVRNTKDSILPVDSKIVSTTCRPGNQTVGVPASRR